MPDNNKRYTVNVTETAKEMLLSHVNFFANVSVSASNQMIEAFIKAATNLAQMPERNPWLQHNDIPFQKYRKLLFYKHCMALYEIRDGIVYITAVVDCRQDYGWMVSK